MAATLKLSVEAPQEAPAPLPTLCDLLENGVYLLFLLRDGSAPGDCAEFNRRVDQYLAQYEKQARELGKVGAQIEHAKYAFCALMDEIMLSSKFPMRDEWARRPLQLRLFKEHLAGEGFFDRLDALRADTIGNIEVLEVFYTCLLLGYQGRYLIAGQEKLGYLVRQIGQDIRRVRGDNYKFAPNWALPHRFGSFVREQMPMWLYAGLLALILALAYGGFSVLLDTQASQILGFLK